MSTTCPRCFGTHPDGVCTAAVAPQVADASGPAFNAELPAGFAVGEYVIEAKIGDGGFGTVYRAQHPVIGKPAAVKVLRHEYSASPEMVQRFISEARAVNKIRHTNIIDVFSFGQLPDGRRFYVMELLEGRTLDDVLLQQGVCEPTLAVPILGGIARALEAAHTHGVVHRDLKPENVFLVRGEDGRMQVKLLDFGIAKLQGGAPSTTRAGAAMGTPHYMSPEQWRGKNVDHRTDIYAFGVVAYRLFTGYFPYDAEDVMEIMVLQSTHAAKRPSEYNGALPAALDEPILRMLDRDPDKRPQSVLLALEAVARATGMTTPAHTPDYAALSELARVRWNRDLPTMAAPASTSSEPRNAPGVHARAPGAVTTTGAAASDPAPLTQGTRRTARGRLVVAAVAAVAVLAGASALLSRGIRPNVSSAGATTAGAPGAAPRVVAPVSEPPPPSVSAASASHVAIIVTSTPPNVDVYLGGEKIGNAPGPIAIKRSDEGVTLRLSAPGYESEDVAVAGDRDSAVSVKLRPKQAPGAARPTRSAPAPRATAHGKDSLEAF